MSSMYRGEQDFQFSLRSQTDHPPYAQKRKGVRQAAPFSQSPMMALQLKLFVFIIELKSSFHVTIESSETVSGLKGRIWEKRKNDLKGVDTYQLTLYKVELPDDRTLG